MSKTVTAIVPAYNEEKNIKRVLDVLEEALNYGIISEIIVVDDGSEDNTSKEAFKYNTKVLRLIENKGKARAMAEGLNVTQGEISLFIDADLVNLKTEYITKLIKPVVENGNIITIARFTNGRLSTDIAHTLNIDCSGQRCAKTQAFRNIFTTIRKIDKVKYGIENIITNRLKEFKIETIYVEWPGVSQILKEEKWGLLNGIFWRFRMYTHMNLGHLRNFFYKIFKLLNIKEASE